MTTVAPEVIAHLDFEHAPPCDYLSHEQWGNGPAVLRIHWTAKPCGCANQRVCLYCDGCWRHLLSGIGGAIRCRPGCGLIYPVWPTILSVTRL